MTKKILTRDDLGKVQLQTKEVEVLAWGGSVLIREMTGTQRDSYEAEITGGKYGKNAKLDLQNARAKLIARCLVDEAGKLLYDFRNTSDVMALGKLPAAGLDLLFDECQKLNGITAEDQAELVGNLPQALNGDSGLDSH